MKSDLITSVTAAIVAALIAYFICGMFLPGLENVSFPALEGESDYNLTDPNVDVFNYRAINPTVEVYVGDCTEYDANGNCLDDKEEIKDQAKDEIDDIVEDTENTDNPENQETENGTTD